MQKKLLAVMLAALICTAPGCTKKPGGGFSAPKSEGTPKPVRVDGLHNPILTEYADGTFKKAENGKLFLENNGETRTFVLSERAESDLTVLKIEDGTRIIVNYNILEDGTEEAESLEKIISES